MTGFALLDVAIGVIFAFLTFSLIASSMQEALASIFNWRGRMLRRGLFRLLESGTKSDALLGQTNISQVLNKAELTLDLLNDPTMRSLQGSKSLIGRLWDQLVGWRHRQKFWRDYANAETRMREADLLNGADAATTLNRAATEPALEAKVKEAGVDPEILQTIKAKAQGRMPSNIPKEAFAQSLLNTLYQKVQKEIEAQVAEVQDIAVSSIEEAKDKFNQALADAAAAAEQARQAAIQNNQEPPADDPTTLSDDVMREARNLLAPSAESVKAYANRLANSVDVALKDADKLIADLPMNPALQKKVRSALKGMAVAKALQARFDEVDRVIDGAADEVTKVINALEDEVAKTTAEIANWFDQGMDRVTGWYVRRAKYVLFLLGFGMAMLANFDIIGYSAQLLNNDQLRAQIVNQAQEAVKNENVAGLEVQRKTTEIFAALEVNENGDGTISKDELEKNLAALTPEVRAELGIDEAALTELAKTEGARDAHLEKVAASLTEVFKNMLGAFAKDADDDGTIDDAELNAAAKAYMANVKAEFQKSSNVLKTQFADQGVKMGRVCLVQEEPSAPAEDDGKTDTGAWVHDTFWKNSLAQCIKDTWEMQAFLSWLIIGFGCTFGGQFWFDLLKNLLKVRAASSGLSSDLKKLVSGSDKKDDTGQNGGNPAPGTQ